MTFDLVSLQPLLLLLAAVGLLLSLSTEQTQIVAKTRSASVGKVATGYMNAMRIMIFNRAGTITYSFCIALCIDTGVTNVSLLAVSILASLGIILYNINLVINRDKILGAVTGNKDRRLKSYLFERDSRHTVACFFATLCNILGLTIPFLLSNTFPDYRLTMANTGFILNTFFTLINIFILETRYAYILDHEDNESLYDFVIKIFVTRVLATVTAVIIMLYLMTYFI